jgi:hypothetical protein
LLVAGLGLPAGAAAAAAAAYGLVEEGVLPGKYRIAGRAAPTLQPPAGL